MSKGPEFFRRMAEASRDGLWVIEADGTTSYCNEAMAAFLGRPRDEVLGRPAALFFDTPGQAALANHLAALDNAPDDDPGADNRELQVIRPDGTAVWLLASHSPIRDESGRRIGWVHRLTENTEQKRLLDALTAREALLATAQEIAAIGSWQWDVVADTVAWSDQLYRIFNVAPEEFEATYAGFLDFVHPDDRLMVEETVESTVEGADEFAWDCRIIPRGGSVRWVRCLGRVERGPDGAPAKMGGTAQDITERVVADRQAAEATRRLHLLQTMAEAANQTNDLEEAVALAEVGLPAFTTWLGMADFRYDADGTLTATNDFSSDGERWRPAPDPELAELCRQTGSLVHRPVPGHETTHSIVAIPVLLDGQVTCVIEVLADEVPPDENSRILMDQVSQQLSQVAGRDASRKALAEARDRAMEASQLKSEFLATMSHEIRTPMNGVIGLNDLLLRTDLDEHQRRLAVGLQGASLTLLEIINDILDLSKIEAGKLELEEVDFEVRAVFEKTADLLRGRAHDKGVELVVACHPDVPGWLRGDPGRLGQVLANLGSNAVKFTEQGEVAIHARVESEHDERVVLRVDVTDTGVGIEPAQVESLFDAFTQADPSTTREHGGTGLGLAISRQITALLGGEIWVESTPGRGSTFSFTADLGRATEPRETRAAAGTPDVSRTQTAPVPDRRILVVEDNQINQMVAVGLLENAGYVADVAADGAEAIDALLGDHGYAAVLMDCRMPRVDGFAATRAIRAAEPAGARVPIIAMTASALEGEQERCVAAGMDDFLTKPVDPVRLLHVVRRWADASTTSPAPAATTAAPSPSPSAGAEVTDAARMTMLDGLRRNGTSLLERAAANFVAHAPAMVAAIRTAVEAGDADALAGAAHKLKGSAINIGLPALGAAAGALEELGFDGHTDGAADRLVVLEVEVERAVAALEPVCTPDR